MWIRCLVVPMAFAALPPLAAAGSGPAPVVAKVGGKTISRSLLNEKLKAKVGNLGYHRSASPARMLELEREALDGLIEEELILLEAARRKIAPAASDVARRLEEKIAKHGGRANFDTLLARSGHSAADYRARIVREATLERMLEVADAEQGRIDAGTARAHHSANRDRYMKPASFKVTHILVKVDPSGGKAAREGALRIASEIAAALRGGDAFNDVAERYNGPEFRDLGWVHDGSLMPELTAGLDKTAIGETTDPLRTMYGFHVMQLLGKKDPVPLAFEDVSAAVMTELEKVRRTASRAMLLRRCRDRWSVARQLGHAAPH